MGNQGSYIGLSLVTTSGVLKYGGSGADIAMTIAKGLATMDLRAGQATVEDDARLIRASVEMLSGGCDAANKLVREAIRHALMRMGQTIEQDFSELIGLLNTYQPVPNTPQPEEGSKDSSFHAWATQMLTVSTRGIR